jgi:pyruvate formate lyase activating enzyme
MNPGTQPHPDRAPRVTRRDFLRAACAAGGAFAFGAPFAWGAVDDRFVREARFYEKQDEGRVRCTLCPRGCSVAPGSRGYCRVRENRGGKYMTLVYGAPVSVHNDPIEKKPLFHVMPGSAAFSLATVGCNIHCKFCQNWDISQASPERNPPAFAGPAAIVASARKAGSAALAFTYSEPTVFYEYMADCAREARDAGLGSVVISNGYIAKAPLKELTALVTAVKIDLKAFTQDFYEDVCEGQLQPVLDTLKRLRDAGAWFEIVVLVIPTLNDKSDEVKQLAGWVVKNLGQDVPLHFTRFHPTYKLTTIERTPAATVQRARELAIQEGCRFVYTGNMPGVDSEHTYCPSCRKAVIERYGFQVTANRLVDGRCPCGATVPGVWRLPVRQPPTPAPAAQTKG